VQAEDEVVLKEATMYKSIIWGTDGSTESDRALPAILDLGAQPGVEVTVLHVDEHFYGGRSSGQSIFADEPDLRSKIESQVEGLRKAGLNVHFELLTKHDGEPADAIADFATDNRGDLIVVATRGHGRFAGALLGSFAQRLLHVAPCPVLVVTPATRVGAKQPALV
jgi:nucleotide-binding universal stress UspA family protein